MNLFELYLNEINKIIIDTFPDINLKERDIFKKIVLEPPKNKNFGDMSTNAAMILSSSLKMNPMNIAEVIVKKLITHEDVMEATFIKPGFINIIYNKNVWHRLIIDLLSNKKGWVFNNIGKNKKINVEFVSANPTGPLHVGHVRGAVFGDTLSSILTSVGYIVTREYYVNDAGKQIEKLVESSFLRYLEVLKKKKIIIPNGLYPGEYLKKVGAKLEKNYKHDLAELSFDQYFFKIKDTVLKYLLDEIKKDLKSVGISMDVFSSEQRIVDSGKLEEVLKILKKKNLIYTGVLDKPKGKQDDDWEPRPQLLFKSKIFGDDNDRALKKSDDSWTYFASDIAYHFDKVKRTKGDLINVLGADHGGYTSRLTSAVKAISNNKYKLTNKICSIVHLIEAGKSIKMSKRSGNFVTLAEIIEKVGKDVIRFMMLTRRNDQTIEFDFKKVQNQSKDNPVFYVHYAYARCQSIIRMSGLKEEQINIQNICLLKNKEDISLIKLIAQWPRIVENSAKYMEPHRICFYLIDLASEFHSLWNKGKIDDDFKFINNNDLELTHSKLALIKSISITIKSAFKILSIEPMEKM